MDGIGIPEVVAVLGAVGLGAATESLLLKTGVSDAAKKVNTALGQFNTALTEQTKTLKQTNKSLLKFDEEVRHLCQDLQKWVEKCGCCCDNSSSSQSPLGGLFLGGGSPQGGGSDVGGSSGGGGTVTTAEVRGRSAVNVEIHNYGPQNEGSQSAGGGRDLHQLVGEVIAKDVRRGGPASNAMKRAFGIARQPIQR
jgi:hypothetical protein